MVIAVGFDIDNTLTPPMGQIQDSTVKLLTELSQLPHVHIFICGGSNREKAVKQLGTHVLDSLAYHAFSENGAVYYSKGQQVAVDKLEDYLGDEQVSRLIQFLLRLLADCPSPWRTGTFIERRNCMLNISPIGRDCSPEQREAFYTWDQQNHCRQELVRQITTAFPDLPIDVTIGGMISCDLIIRGFDKTRCLQYLHDYEEIHYVGDRVRPGGNDYELYSHDSVVGHETNGYQNTEEIIRSLLLSLKGTSKDYRVSSPSQQTGLPLEAHDFPAT